MRRVGLVGIARESVAPVIGCLLHLVPVVEAVVAALPVHRAARILRRQGEVHERIRGHLSRALHVDLYTIGIDGIDPVVPARCLGRIHQGQRIATIGEFVLAVQIHRHARD